MVGIHCLLRSARPALYSLGFAQPDREVPWFATGGSYLVLVSLVHKERGILGEGDFMSFGQGIIGPAFQSCYFSSKGKIKSKSDGGDSGEESLSKKELALQQAVDHITSSFGKGSIMWLGRSHAPKEVPVVSTGSLSLDIALGIGGFPKGRVVEIYGPEAAGKTTLALHVIAEAPKKGGYCAFVDADHALDPALARSIGVNTDNLLLSQPDSMEQALSLVDTLIRSGSVDVLVVDSVAALVPKSELDGEMRDAHMALQARLMSQALGKLIHPLSQSQTILLFINQEIVDTVRSKLRFGRPTKITTGYNALKFYASVRLRMKQIGFLKKGGESFGQGIIGPAFQSCYFSSKGKRKSKSDGGDSGEESLSKKELALQQALDHITSSFGKGSIMWLGRSHTPKEVPVVSTGSFSLDIALGIGGFPKGRVVEIYGPEASGKTTLALHVIAEAQKKGGYCAFVDAEHALDPALARSIGVNTDNLLLSQPDSGEQALSLVDTLIRSGSIDVLVVDSVAALVPKSELDGEMGDAHMALQARLMSQALRKLTHPLSQSQTILLFINQVRSKLSTFGGFGGPTEVTTGGNALKFYASVRLNMKRIGSVKKGEEILGSQVLVKIVKNKHAPPFKMVQFELEFGKGISRESEIIELGIKHKFITKGGGAFYGFEGQNFRGKDAVKRYLIENEGIREELVMKLREKIRVDSDKLEDMISPGTTNENIVALN